ncbi:MAG: L-rhamnose mutarotase [Gemmatimonadaceae bacterium]|nr:L-rhamnose mutarotase [Gemmatimonadaceae bacterium]
MNTSNTRRSCLALDLRDDPALIAEYCRQHERIWPEIAASIREAGIVSMEIWRIENRLFMVMETSAHFDAVAKAVADATNPKVQEWEAFMWRFQQPLPWASHGEKWMPMSKLFDLDHQP